MPITDPRLDSSIINNALSRTYDTSSVFTEETPYKPFERYKGYKVDLRLSPDELENDLSKQQSYWDRLSNDLTIAGANAAAMFGSVMMSTKDILSGDFKLDGTLSETQQALYDWRKGVEEDNITFESDFDREHPIMSALLPTALTGFKSTKGWGETLLKSGAYGAGAIAAVGLQELAITAATQGTGTIPSLAMNVSRLLRLPTEVANAGRSMVNSVKTYSDFRKAYSTVKGSLLAIDTARAAQLGLNTTKYLTRGLASSYGEASFEGLESKENLTQTLIKNIEDRYGRPPTPEEMVEIEQKSQEAATMRFYTNLGLLTLTGGYEIGQIFKPVNQFKDLVDQGSYLGLKKTFTKDGVKFEKDIFKLRDREWFKTPVGSLTRRTVENVGNITKNFKQLDFALMEGVEEFSQMWIDKSTENYYMGRFNKDVNTSVVNSVLSGLDDSLNKDGFIAAMSGIMGGTAQSLLFRETGNAYKKWQRGEFGKDRIEKRKQQFENFNTRVKEINDALNLSGEHIDEIRNAVNIKSVGGTLDGKVDNTKDQVYTSYLQNLAPDGNLGLETMATFHLIKPFASQGLGDVYKEYLGLQFDETVENLSERNELKSFYSTEIDKVSRIFNKINSLYKNPYNYQTHSKEFRYYEDWKSHVAGISYTKNRYDEFVANLSPKKLEDSDVFFDKTKFKSRVEVQLNDNNKTLELFSQVELDDTQKSLKSELLEKNKNLELILENLDKSDEIVFRIMHEEFLANNLDSQTDPIFSSQEYIQELKMIADNRFSLYNLTKGLNILVNAKSPKEVIDQMKAKEEEAQDLNDKIESETDVEVTPSPEVVEEAPTSEVVEEKPPVKEEKKSVTKEENKEEVKTSNETEAEVQKADIRSKFATGLFLLEKNDKGEYVISLDKEKRYNTVQDKVEFLEKLFEGTLDLNDYEVVRVVSEEKSFNTIPMEKGLQFNTSPSYYYSLVKKNSNTLEEITKIQSPDSIVVNPEVIPELNKYKLGIKNGDTILDLARKIKSKKFTDIQKGQISEIIHSSKTVSQLGLDSWVNKTIVHFEAVEKLVKNRNEEQIKDNLFNYFTPYPHITDFYSGENEYEADSVPFHYMLNPKVKDGKLYKPVAIIENGEWVVLATNENGDLVELTKDDININLNVKQVKSSAFIVVPSFSFDEEISYNTKPLLRTTVTDIVDQLVNAFKKDGETGIRDYLRENVRLQSQKITKNPTVFVTEKDGKITINIKEDTKPLHNLVLELQEDGSYVLINKDDIGFYPRTTDRLSAYSTLTSKLYKVKQPYSNYRINIEAKSNVVEEPVVSVEKTEEMSIDDALASGSLQQVAPTTDAVLQPTDPNSLESLVGKGRTEPITTSTESLRDTALELKPVENPKTSTISLNYDASDLTLKKDYEVVDENKVDSFLKKFTKPEQIIKALPKMLEQNWIKEISKPSERNIKVLTLNIEQQIQAHITNCHG